MSLPEFVGDPILVQARFLPEGRVQPATFRWRNRVRPIASMGRQWEEEAEGTLWQCYIVQTQDGEVFELRLDPASMRWILARAWLRPAPEA